MKMVECEKMKIVIKGNNAKCGGSDRLGEQPFYLLGYINGCNKKSA